MIYTSRNWKLYQSQILSKDADLFLKISFFFRCCSHDFAIANELPGFSISRLANVGGVLNVNIFGRIDNHSVYLCSMFDMFRKVLKTSLRYVFMASSRHVIKTSWRRLDFKTFWKTKNWYAKDVMKASSIHDLKTPLRRIQG